MHKLLIAAAVAAFAAPALAAEPYDDRLEEEIRRAIPPSEQVEAMAPAMDAMVGALLGVDVGPIMDATDPFRRRYDHGRRGRTLGALGARDDPYFEQRIRGSIYGATADMGRMVDAVGAAAPALARSLREVERAMDHAIEDYERRRDDARGRGEYRRLYPDD
jgi:hypothetical protein